MIAPSGETTRQQPRRQARPKRVALLQPPFFRTLGSENRRAAPGAVLDANLLKDAGYQTALIHADAALQPGTQLKWRELFTASATRLTREAVLEGLHALWPELRRRLEQVQPDAVVVLAGDWVESAKDIADPAISIELGRLISALGLSPIATGGLPSRFSERFARAYPVVISGPPGRTLISVIEAPARFRGILPGRGVQDYLNVPAYPRRADTTLDYSQIVTEFGCRWGKCLGFCPIAQMFGAGTKVRPDNLIVEDVRSRRENVMNIVDTCFGWDLDRLTTLAPRLAGAQKRYVVTTRMEFAVQPAVRGAFKRMNCRLVKLGIESLFDPMLRRMHKGQTARAVMAGLRLLHAEGVDVFGYLLLGFPGETAETLRETLSRAQELDFVTWLPNIYCPIDDDSPEAHHFSLPQAEKLGLPQDIVAEFFELHKPRNSRATPPPAQGVPVDPIPLAQGCE